MQNLTVNQLRDSLTWIETNYDTAMDQGAIGLANALRDKRDLLWAELVRRIQADDPYTTEADIRYFEVDEQRNWYDTSRELA